MEKVKLTQEQADAIETLKEKAKGMLVVDLLEALKNGYAVEEEYKVGDWVVYKSAQKGLIICKVESVSGVKVDTDYVASNGYKQSFGKSQIRHATPEEIKAEQERRVWARIGREVNEWRKGDVYVHRRYAEAFAIDHKDALRLASERYEEGLVIGIYPYESFISFGGESHDN